MDESTLKKIIAGISNLPPLPEVASRLLELTADADISIEQVIETIGMDPSLSAAVLKLSNSAFYGRVMRVSTLKQAVQVLGFVAVRNLVLLVSVFKTFKNLKKDRRFNPIELWKHSFLCGLAAEILAIHLGENSSEFFIMGLMHDIGKLLLYQKAHDDYIKVIEASGNCLFNTIQKENELLGIDHTIVGSILFKKWMFPASLLSAVEFHHSPWKSPENKRFPIVINIADILSHPIEFTESEEPPADVVNALFHPEVNALFTAKGIEWNTATLIEYKKEVMIQQDKKQDFFDLLLS